MSSLRPLTTIDDPKSLGRVRQLVDQDEIVVHTARLKNRGLLPVALKAALWAVKPGGHVRIVDDAPRDATAPWEAPANNLNHWVALLSSRDAVRCQPEAGAGGDIELKRTASVLAPGWSAGVVFSGRDSELPQLLACLAGLRAQPELSAAQGGEIVVCGPQRDLAFLDAFPDVRYLVFEMPPGRVMITQKKNALMRSLRGPRLAVLHTRIVLEPGALAAVPREFDLCSPNTAVIESGRRVPYLSLCATEAFMPGRTPYDASHTMRGVRSGDPLELHGRGMLFVDGGAFFVTKRLHDDCALDDTVAWLEGEDVEWCLRAQAHGWLVELAPGAGALSQTNKLQPLPRPGLARAASLVWHKLKTVRHGLLQIAGVR